MSPTWIDQFRELREAITSDPHSFSDDLQKVLWALSVTKSDLDLAYLTPSQIAEALCDIDGIHIPRQRIAALLAKEKTTVVRKRIAGKNCYKIMRAGEIEIDRANMSSTAYVDPANALSEIRRFEEILSCLKGGLKICDPYVDNKTVDFLAECRAATDAKLLTCNVLGDAKLRRDLAAFRKEHSLVLDLKLAEVGLLHDRYIIHQDGMLLLGTSLNSFAKKQSFIVNVGSDIRAATEKAFDIYWARSRVF